MPTPDTWDLPPMIGDDDYPDLLNRAWDNGHITTEEALERLKLHDGIRRVQERSGEIKVAEPAVVADPLDEIARELLKPKLVPAAQVGEDAEDGEWEPLAPSPITAHDPAASNGHKLPPASGPRLINASTIKPNRVEWLVPRLVPLQAVSVLFGFGGEGKSMWACGVAAKLSKQRGHTLYLTAEDSLGFTLLPRLIAAGADLDRIHFAAIDRDGIEDGFYFPKDVAALDELVAQTNASLVVVDPLAAHLDNVNSWNDQSVRRALAPLHRLAVTRNCAVLCIAHANRGEGQAPLARLQGSLGIGKAARSVMLFAHDPDDPAGAASNRRIVARVKCNLDPPVQSFVYEIKPVLLPAVDEQPEIQTARIDGLGQTDVQGDALLRHVAPEERAERAEIDDWLRAELIDGEDHPATEVYANGREQDYTEKQLRVAAHRIGARISREQKFKAKSMWRLPSANERQP
jgi:hypothetical protein